MAVAFIAGYELSAATRVSRNTNVRSSESESGVLRFIDLGAQTYWGITVVCENISEAQMDTLVDWLAANEQAEIALPVSTNTYNGYIDPRGYVRAAPDQRNPNLWTVAFLFKGIKQ